MLPDNKTQKRVTKLLIFCKKQIFFEFFLVKFCPDSDIYRYSVWCLCGK